MATISRTAFEQLFQKHLPDNESGEITPEHIRRVFDDLSDSVIWHDEATSGPDGSSAYDVAVSAGFAGTETEWLASLVGPVGVAGPQGAKGADGRTVAAVRSILSAIHLVTAADDGVVLVFNVDGGATVTLPDDNTEPLRIGAMVYGLRSGGGPVAMAAAPGVNINAVEGFLPQTRQHNGMISALKIGANDWKVLGDLEKKPDSIINANGGAVGAVRLIEAPTATLTLADVGGVVELSHDDASTLILPTDATVGIPEGAVVHVVQAGTGSVMLAAEAGAQALICCKQAMQVAGQHGVVRAIKTAPNTWRVTGDLADVHAFA